jgi:hypothetical protein
MSKYKQVFEMMLKQNQEDFDNFQMVHDNFLKDPKKWKEEFDHQGRDIQDIIRRYENILCGKSENSGYGKYSTELSAKFQQEIRKLFPKIDFVGAE